MLVHFCLSSPRCTPAERESKYITHQGCKYKDPLTIQCGSFRKYLGLLSTTARLPAHSSVSTHVVTYKDMDLYIIYLFTHLAGSPSRRSRWGGGGCTCPSPRPGGPTPYRRCPAAHRGSGGDGEGAMKAYTMYMIHVMYICKRRGWNHFEALV